ncbi:MAG: response regulator [Candidatus Thiodiazotropha sp. (ex Epidulcina cf. delphinae)]|nr:response regulator [Candidatus Thiodiazotropha sp. (ex Epidulcina cf. delphinae)]
MNAGVQATIFIVDDDDSVRRAIANLLRAAGYATSTFASGREFLDHPGDEPGCVILDLCMPDTNGLELQEQLACRAYHPPIVFLSGQGNVSSTASALKKGAVDFLEKPINDDVLLAAVADALQRDQKKREQMQQTADIAARLAKLSAREFQVLQHVIAGSLNKQIAYALGISEKTIKVHRARVMEKMEAHSVAKLVRLTEKMGVHPIDSAATKVQ